MYCGNCGKQINDDSKFCQHCGYAVVFHEPNVVAPKTTLNTTPVTPNQQNRRKPKKKSIFKRWWFWVIVVALLFVSCVGTSDPAEEEPAPTKITESEYKSMCAEIDFDQLARNPDNYKDQMFRFTGEVIQVIEGNNTTQLRMDVTLVDVGTDWAYYEDTIYVTLPKEEGADRILEEDIITIYGVCSGAESYRSILGEKITLPGIDAEYYELIQ